MLGSNKLLLTPKILPITPQSDSSKLLKQCKPTKYLSKSSEYFKVDNNLSEIDTEAERLAARLNLGIEYGESAWGKIKGHLEDQLDLMERFTDLQNKIKVNAEDITKLIYRNSLNIYKILPDLDSLYSLTEIKIGALYAVGPEEDDKYKIFIHTGEEWTYMGYLNSASVDITQEVGNSENLVMSQKAIKENFIASSSVRNIDTSHTQEEIESMIEDGTIDPYTLYLAFESDE